MQTRRPPDLPPRAANPPEIRPLRMPSPRAGEPPFLKAVTGLNFGDLVANVPGAPGRMAIATSTNKLYYWDNGWGPAILGS